MYQKRDGEVTGVIENERLPLFPDDAELDSQRYREFAQGFVTFLAERLRSGEPGWDGHDFAWRVLEYFEVGPREDAAGPEAPPQPDDNP